MKNLILGLCVLILAGCCSGNDCCKKSMMFNDKYATGYVIAKPIGNTYGIIEMHDRHQHDNSYLAFYNHDLGDLKIDSQYYVRVQDICDFPKVIEMKKNVARAKMYFGPPITFFDYHILSDHGMQANWHRKGHRIQNGYRPEQKQLDVKVGNINRTFIVPDHLSDMAEKINRSATADTIYFDFKNSIGSMDSLLKLDTFHRHGKRTFKF